MSDEEYCLGVLMRVDGFTCAKCGKRGSDKCRTICRNVENMTKM